MFGGIGRFFSNLVGGNNNNNQQNNGGNLVDAARRADEERRQREEEERRRKEEERKEQERQAKIAAERQAAEQARVRQAQEQQARNAAASASIANRTSGIGDNTNAAIGINTPVNQNNNRTYTSNVDELSKEFIDEERKRVNQNTGFLERTFNGGNLERIAQANAQNRAISRINEQNNYEKPEETRLALQRNMQNQSQTHQNIQNNLKTLDRVDKGMVDAYSKLQYTPGVSLGVEGVGTVGALALGDDSQVNKRLVKLTQDVDWDSLDQDQKNQVGALRNVGGLLSTLDVVPGIGAGGKVGKQSIGAFARGGFKDVAKTAAIRGATGAVGGGVLGGALTGAFGGDVLEGASKGAIGGAVGGIIGTPFEGATAAGRSAKGAIGSINDTVVNNLDDTLQNVKNADDGLTRGAVKVNPRANVDKTTIGATRAFGGDLDDLAQVAGETAEGTIRNEGKSARGSSLTEQSPEIDIDTPAYIRRREAQAKTAAEQADFNARVEADPSMTPSFLYKRQAQSIADNANNQIRNIGEQIDYGIRTGDVTDDQIRKAIDDATFRQQQISEDAQNQIDNVFKQREADRMAGEATENLGDAIDTTASNNDIIANQIDNTVRGTTVAQDPQAASLSAQQVAEMPPQAATSSAPVASQQTVVGSPDAMARYYDENAVDPGVAETPVRADGGIAASRLQKELGGSVNPEIQRNRFNIAESEARAQNMYGNLSDEAIAKTAKDFSINGPEDIVAVNNLIEQIDRLPAGEAKTQAMADVIDKVSRSSSQSGQNLRATRELYASLPTDFQIESLDAKIRTAGGNGLTPTQRVELANSIDGMKMAKSQMDNVAEQADYLRQQLINGGGTGNPAADAKRANDMLNQFYDAQRAAEQTQTLNSKLIRNITDTAGLPRKVVDGFIDVYRTVLLSGISGRVADVGSTALNAATDVGARELSGAIGSTINKLSGGRTNFRGSLLKYSDQGVRGTREGLKDVGGRLTGAMPGYGRLGFTNQNPLSRGVGALTELATGATKGSETLQLFADAEAVVKAQNPRLSGQELRAATTLQAISEMANPGSEIAENAAKFHRGINLMGRDNKISETVGNLMDSAGKTATGRVLSTIAAPFSGFASNSLYRNLTRNPVGDAITLGHQGLKQLRDGGQGQNILDTVGNLVVDTGKTAAAYNLRDTGNIVDEDNDGQNWEGMYLTDGNGTSPISRFFPGDNTIAALGVAASDALNGNQEGLKQLAPNLIGNALSPLDPTSSSLAKAIGYGSQGNWEKAGQQAGRIVKPFWDNSAEGGVQNKILGGANGRKDFNAITGQSEQSFIDRIFQNPAQSQKTSDRRSNEAAAKQNNVGSWYEVKADQDKEGKTSQKIVRNDDKEPAYTGDITNLRDSMKKNGYRDDQIDNAINMLSMTKNEAIADFETNGKQNAVRRYAEAQLEALKASNDPSEKALKQAERQLKLARVNEENEVPVELQKLYNETSVTDWREMEETNPEMYNALWQYGKLLADNGVRKTGSEADFDNTSENNENKYYVANKKSGSGGSRRSGSGSGKNSFSTSIGTIKTGDGLKQLTAKQASAQVQNKMPQLKTIEKRLKKIPISVKNGFSQ